MNKYKYAQGSILRLVDNVTIPIHLGNRDYHEYLQYVSDGGLTDPEFTIEEEAAKALVKADADIRAKYSGMLLEITHPYGASERETWKTQEEEALQFEIDPNAPCIMIRQMASVRGITMELMVSKILGNATLFRQASGQALGMQQAELDVLKGGA